MSDYRQMMHELYEAHQNFKKEWDDWRNAKIKPTEKKKFKKSRGLEAENVSIARDKFLDALNRLFDTKLAPLEIKSNETPLKAVDEIIEFLSVDIPCHRCGYVKETFLTKLKSVFLTFEQQKQLQQIALDLCRNPRYRREFGDWARLMVKIADQLFIGEMNKLSENSDEKIRATSKWMKNKIAANRKDLQAAID